MLHAIQETKKEQQVQSQAISKLEVQVGQIANALNEREQGRFPSQPLVNLRGQFEKHETMKAVITLRSGKKIDNEVRGSRYVQEEKQQKEFKIGIDDIVAIPEVTVSVEEGSETRIEESTVSILGRKTDPKPVTSSSPMTTLKPST